MFILQPLSVETIWGSNRLHAFGGDRTMRHIGQLYTVAAQAGYSNRIVGGPHDGRTLREVYTEDPASFGWRGEFPLLIGFVDACQNLSIQVHPTDAYARANLGLPYGKSESWFFLEPPADGAIYMGTTAKTVAEIRAAVEERRVMDVVGRLPVGRDAYVFVTAGTIHALTAGSLVYEIQQSTDITYRFYDYDRVDAAGHSRPLHQNKALAVIDPGRTATAQPGAVGSAFEEPYYRVQRTELTGPYHNNGEAFACVTLLGGELRADGRAITAGMSFLALPGETVELTGRADCVIATAKENAQ